MKSQWPRKANVFFKFWQCNYHFLQDSVHVNCSDCFYDFSAKSFLLLPVLHFNNIWLYFKPRTEHLSYLHYCLSSYWNTLSPVFPCKNLIFLVDVCVWGGWGFVYYTEMEKFYMYLEVCFHMKPCVNWWKIVSFMVPQSHVLLLLLSG